MPQITANDVTLEYEAHGDPANPSLLLIMGLGAQMTLWPVELVEALVARGYYVIRYDNRDIGLSQKFTEHPVPNVRKVALMRLFGLRAKLPYRLTDMAADAVGLLDALGIARAHVVGASMGGMIAQLVAATYPERVRSLTSIMSTTGNRRLPPAKREALNALIAPVAPDATLAQLVPHVINISRAIGSPAYPPSQARLTERITRDYHRSFHPTGPGRQLAAIVDDGDRRARLKAVTAPTLVLHGQDDPLIPVEGAHDTAAHITGSRLHVIPGMGHDLPLELVDEVADQIAAIAR